MDNIGSELYTEDGEIYANIPMLNGNNIKQIRNFVRDRLAYVDTEIYQTNNIEATNVLVGMTWDRGSINNSGVHIDTAYDMRSSFIDILPLKEGGGGTYNVVVDGNVIGAKLVFYKANEEFNYVHDSTNSDLNSKYDFGDDAKIFVFNYGQYQTSTHLRVVINSAGANKKLYVGIYKLVDDVPVLVDHCYVDNIVVS